jgi:hypothetical protein
MAMTPKPKKTQLAELHALAAEGLQIYAINKDPLTAHAVQLLFQATKLPLSIPQQNAAIVLRNQRDAYLTLFTAPLM